MNCRDLLCDHSRFNLSRSLQDALNYVHKCKQFLGCWGGHVGVQINSKMSLNFCITIESNYQRLFAIVLYTNMAAVKPAASQGLQKQTRKKLNNVLGCRDGAVMRVLAFHQCIARVRFPDPASNVGWVCWFSTLYREVFSGNSGFPSPHKAKFYLIVLIVNYNCSVPN